MLLNESGIQMSLKGNNAFRQFTSLSWRDNFRGVGSIKRMNKEKKKTTQKLATVRSCYHPKA